MRSSELAFALLLWSATGSSSIAQAEPQAQGFGVERLVPSAPGSGWFVMDTLDMHGALGGVVSMVTSFARNPLRISDGSQELAVVSDDAFVQIGFAATYDRWRAHVSFDSPLLVRGNSGTLAGYSFAAPDIQLAKAPDALANGRVGLDARLFGEPTDAFRFGLGAELWFPGGGPGATRAGYLTDETYGATGRVLFAGDVGLFSYAGHLGARLRPLDDAKAPGGPEGSELVFGGAAGGTAPIDSNARVTVGPELYGATAFRSFLRSGTTALEGLLGARVEIGGNDAPWLRVKLGAGGGIDPHFGAAEWRVALGIELIGQMTGKEAGEQEPLQTSSSTIARGAPRSEG